MKEMYPVEDNGSCAGHVAVTREGLYYRFRCRVKLKQNRICRLQLCGDGDCIDLGILIPVNEHYELDKKIPAKHIKDNNCIFKLIENGANERFIPICENVSFPNIDKIHNARFSVCNNVPGLIIRD